MKLATSFPILDLSSIGEVRRHVARWTSTALLNETLQGQISIVISELGTNIVKHAGQGEMICICSEFSIDILALDKGPGLTDTRSFEDGFSSQGTAGNGLGAIKRLATHFDYFTAVGKGTIIHASFETKTNESPYTCAGFSIALKGEEVSGDNWTSSQDGTKIMVADGLGHGLLAHTASKAAVDEFENSKHSDPLFDIQLLHGRLRSTRGAAVAVAYLDPKKNVVDYTGLGNISGSIVGRKINKKMISYNGTAGVEMRKIQTLSYPWESDCALIMHSDGLSANWSLEAYPGILIRHPLVIAAVLYRDFYRGKDDVTVVVMKENN